MTYITQQEEILDDKITSFITNETITNDSLVGIDVLNKAYKFDNINLDIKPFYKESMSSYTSTCELVEIKPGYFVSLSTGAGVPESPTSTLYYALYRINKSEVTQLARNFINIYPLVNDQMTGHQNYSKIVRTSDTTFMLIYIAGTSAHKFVAQTYTVDFDALTVTKTGTTYSFTLPKLVGTKVTNEFSEYCNVIPVLSQNYILFSFMYTSAPVTNYVYKITLDSNNLNATNNTLLTSPAPGYSGYLCLYKHLKNDLFLYFEVFGDNNIKCSVVSINATYTTLSSSTNTIFKLQNQNNSISIIEDVDNPNYFYGVYTSGNTELKIIYFKLNIDNTLTLISESLSISNMRTIGSNSALNKIYYKNGSYYVGVSGGIVNFKYDSTQNKIIYIDISFVTLNIAPSSFLCFPLNDNYWLGLYVTKVAGGGATINYSYSVIFKPIRFAGISTETKNVGESLNVKYSGEYQLQNSLYDKNMTYFIDNKKGIIVKDSSVLNISPNFYSDTCKNLIRPNFLVDYNNKISIFDPLYSSLLYNGTLVDKNGVSHLIIDGKIIN